MDHDILEMLFQSFYTGTLLGLTEENVPKVMEVAHHLQAPNAIHSCCTFMLSHLSISNALVYWLSSRVTQTTQIQTASVELLGKHLAKVREMDQFLNMHVDTIVQLLRADELKVESEVEVYNAAMDWIKFELDGRKQHLVNVLAVVRLSQLPIDFLVSVVGEEELIEENSVAMSRYSRILKSKLDKGVLFGRKSMSLSVRALPVEERRHHFVYGVVGRVEEGWDKVRNVLEKFQGMCGEKVKKFSQCCKGGEEENYNDMLLTPSGLSEDAETDSLLSFPDTPVGSNEKEGKEDLEPEKDDSVDSSSAVVVSKETHVQFSV